MKAIKLFALLAVTSFLFACGSGDTGNGGGSKTFKSNGGSASLTSETDTNGGSGGSVYFDIYGDVKVTKSGKVDTNFTVPTYAQTFGNNKLTITANKTVLYNPESTVAGDVYLKFDDSTLYYRDADNVEQIASGLEVKSGATLTLPDNTEGQASTYIPYSVIIDGTVKPAADNVGLRLRSGSLLMIGSSGTVTTKPTAAATTAESLYLYGEVAINKGTIDASGTAATAEAAAGGSAGYLEFAADSFLYNTGQILAKGGSATLGAGGSGNTIYLYAYYASLFNSGTIDSSGGNGATAGGPGGYIGLYGGNEGYVGSLIIDGSLLANGGNGGTGDGGVGNDIEFDVNAGKLWSSATISSKGGSSTSAAGAHGGNVDLYADYDEDYGEGNYVENKGIKLSGNIDLSGGDGPTGGGNGGDLSIDNSYSDAGMLPTPAAEMVGFASFTMDGGAGIIGGNGGYYEIYTDTYWFAGDYMEAPVGSISNQVPVSAKGGAGSMTASSGQGGSGGYVDFDWGGSYGVYTNLTTSNSGDLNLSGGAGNAGGSGGWVWMYGYGQTTNSGSINAKGGNGTTTGGNGDEVELYSSYDVENSGAIDASGGTGVTGGNGAPYIEMYAGGQTRNSGAITATGGAGSTLGGSGGEIDLFSQMVPTSNSGKLTVTKGAGGSTAIDGWIWIDWVDVGPAHELYT